MNYLVIISFVDFLKKSGDFLINLIVFVILLGLIVGIHEFGHFIFARRAKVLCREFAIGMGPRLWKKRKGETVYSLRAFPIGGFCAIAGEEVEADPFADLKQIKLNVVDGVIKGFYPEVEDESFAYPIYDIVSYDIYDANQTGSLYMEVTKDGENYRFDVDPQAIIYTKKDEFQIAPYNRTLGSKGKLARALVMFGGPMMNFILALIVFFICGLIIGFKDYSSSELGSVTMGDISEVYGKSYTYDEVISLDRTGIVGIYSESIDKDKYYNLNDVSLIDEFLTAYKNKGLNESIVVLYKRDNYLQKGDIITKLYSKTLGFKDNIKDFNDIQAFLDEYNKQGLAEKIKIYYTRDGKEMEIEATPFVAVNSAGIGSGWYYDIDGEVKIKVLSEGLTLSKTGNLADNSELQIGDVIIEIAGIKNPTWADIRKVFDDFVGDFKDEDENWIKIIVRRNIDNEDKEIEVKVKPYSRSLIEGQTALDGEKPEITYATVDLNPDSKFSILKSIAYSGKRTWSSFTSVIDTLKLLFKGTVSVKNLSGPIGIFSIAGQAREAGFTYVLSLLGFLSVNIGLLNLFPIPALDGGRLVFIAYEAITKKKPNPKVETILITVTLILLFGLMIFVAFEDIIRLF